MKHNELYQQTQNRIKNAFSVKNIKTLQNISYLDMYSYIVFDISLLREYPEENTVEISRLSSKWKFTSQDSGIEKIDIEPQFAEVLLQKKHKSDIITCVAVERYIYAGKGDRIITPIHGTTYRGNYRILYQLLVSLDQFLYGEWWKERAPTNKVMKITNLVYLGQQLTDIENGRYIGCIYGLLYKPFFYIVKLAHIDSLG